ncbi:MAG: thioredoxin reductase [Clostridiales bacterium 38-18]|nr:MAG: thioredoxin reductase [Clostridiales bacterium 38-18]
MELNLNLASSKKKSVVLDKGKTYDLLIIGSGPAGLNSALYAKRKGLEVGIIGKKSGGQVVDTTSVENYLGFEYKTGEELVKAFKSHVDSLKVPFLSDAEVTSIHKIENRFMVQLSSGEEIATKAVIIATGSRPRQLGISGEADYLGKGVAYCAICDGPLFEGLEVIVAGGGNSAVEAAIDLAKIASTVKLVHRSQLRADQIVIDKLNTFENVEIYLETEILEVKGAQLMSGIIVKDKKTGEISELAANGLFVEIGYLPNSGFVKDLVKLNERGEIIVNAACETSVEGVFAAGDVTDVPYKQIVISAGEGAKAALTANDYINRLK